MIPRLLLLGLLPLAASPLAAAANPAPAPAASPTRGAAFTADGLLADLTSDFSSHYQLDGALRLELVEPWTPPAATAADWRVSVLEYPPLPQTTMVVRCELIADGSPVETSTLLLRASVWRQGWFVRQPLNYGTLLDPSMLEARPIDTLRQRDAVPTTLGIRDYVASCEVPVDGLVTWRDITLRPLVHRGEIVNVVAEDGMLIVTLKAQALQSGAQGDLVTVRNMQTLKEITGRVVGQDCVAVSF
jgi:flagellar basal body P-ring formation protein FlgA